MCIDDKYCNRYIQLLDFSLTVKAATLIFISECGSDIPSAKKGKSCFIYTIWYRGIESISVLSRANVRVLHENPNRINSELTCINS